MRELIAKTLLGNNNNINMYRGCTHGCIYCDSRSSCYHIDDFENIVVKTNAKNLLRRELCKKRRMPIITTGSMCDPYMPCEKHIGLTRELLSIMNEFHAGISILTKSDLILRDLDLYIKLAKFNKVFIQMTITTFDDELCKKIEPNVCPSSRRFEVLKQFADNGLICGIWLTPILPFINDTEDNIKKIVKKASEVGVKYIFTFDMCLTLREGNREYYYQQLDKHFPGLKQKYIDTYHNDYFIPSPNQNHLNQVLRDECQKSGLICGNFEVYDKLNAKMFYQPSLFDADEL